MTTNKQRQSHILQVGEAAGDRLNTEPAPSDRLPLATPPMFLAADRTVGVDVSSAYMSAVTSVSGPATSPYKVIKKSVT